MSAEPQDMEIYDMARAGALTAESHFCKEAGASLLGPKERCTHCSQPENPPVDTAALAETKVLPRFPGYREMAVGEIIRRGDMVLPMNQTQLQESVAHDAEIEAADVGHYFRPIDPVPHTDGLRKCETHGYVWADEGCAACVSEAETDGALRDIGIRLPAPKAPEGSSPKVPADNLYLPWRQDPIATCDIQDCAGQDIGAMNMSSEAAYVVLAVNSHATLTDALTKAREALRSASMVHQAYHDRGPAVVVQEMKRRLDVARVFLESPALVQALKGGA